MLLQFAMARTSMRDLFGCLQDMRIHGTRDGRGPCGRSAHNHYSMQGDTALKPDSEYREQLRSFGVRGEYIDAFNGLDLDRIGNLVGVLRSDPEMLKPRPETMSINEIRFSLNQVYANGFEAGAIKMARVDASIARQLSASLGRECRMEARLRRLSHVLSGLEAELPVEASEIDTALNRLILGNQVLDAILKDEEPAWPRE